MKKVLAGEYRRFENSLQLLEGDLATLENLLHKQAPHYVGRISVEVTSLSDVLGDWYSLSKCHVKEPSVEGEDLLVGDVDTMERSRTATTASAIDAAAQAATEILASRATSARKTPSLSQLLSRASAAEREVAVTAAIDAADDVARQQWLQDMQSLRDACSSAARSLDFAPIRAQLKEIRRLVTALRDFGPEPSPEHAEDLKRLLSMSEADS